MKLVAIVRSAPDPGEAANAVARASGLTLAEARMRLAPEPPALLARLEEEKAAALVASLRKSGLAALAVGFPVPASKDRTVVRSFSLGDAGAVFVPRSGEPMQVQWADVLAIFRGQRASRSDVERTEKSKSFSAAAAVMTGGLKLTRTSTKTAHSLEESTEQVILVYGRDGRVAHLAEHQLEFSSLGPGMHPSSTGNMVELARRLREKATGAFYDERLLRLGRRPLPFLAGGESRSQEGTVVTTRTETSGSLDVLAQVMRQALAEGLLP
jgi:hypothetical protein